MKKATTQEAYISTFPPKVKSILNKMRLTIHKAAPASEAVISYNMPAFKQNGALVYFAGYSKHIGFYPAGSAIKKFEKELGDYKFSKGAIRFPLDKPLPVRLITRIVKYRVSENRERAKAREKRPLL